MPNSTLEAASHGGVGPDLITFNATISDSLESRKSWRFFFTWEVCLTLVIGVTFGRPSLALIRVHLFVQAVQSIFGSRFVDLVVQSYQVSSIGIPLGGYYFGLCH